MVWSLVTYLFTDLDVITQSIPEKQLLAAILLRTWADLDSVNRFQRNDAFYFLDLEIRADWSFVWICEALNLSPKRVKKAMLTNPYYEQVQKLAPERYGKVKKTRLCYFD